MNLIYESDYEEDFFEISLTTKEIEKILGGKIVKKSFQFPQNYDRKVNILIKSEVHYAIS